MLRLARVVSQFPAQYFGNLAGFNLWKLTWLSGVFPPFVGHFVKRAREREVKLRHVVYEVWLVSYLFFSFQIWYFRKCIITSIGQSKHMRVTRFNPYEFLVSPNRDSFRISLFLFCSSTFSSSNISIFYESICWSPGKYRNCLIVWNRSSHI